MIRQRAMYRMWHVLVVNYCHIHGVIRWEALLFENEYDVGLFQIP